MAERRRVALAEALEENEQLHKEIDNLKTEMEALKSENNMLKPLAEEAEYLAGVLKVKSFHDNMLIRTTVDLFNLKDLLGNSEEEAPPNETTNSNQSDS